jgi:hypothetical protein
MVRWTGFADLTFAEARGSPSARGGASRDRVHLDLPDAWVIETADHLLGRDGGQAADDRAVRRLWALSHAGDVGPGADRDSRTAQRWAQGRDPSISKVAIGDSTPPPQTIWGRGV